MKKSICKQTGTRQHQEQMDTTAQFLMQTTLNGVLQQLERIERVVEGVHRDHPTKRSEEGDRNHVTAEDNFQALKTKLMAFSSLQKLYDGVFQESATANVSQWIGLRPEVSSSPAFAKALLDTLDACKGQYQPTVQPLSMTGETLQELSSRLAMATHHWHHKEKKFNQDHQAYSIKPQAYRIEAGFDKAQVDVEAIRNQLERDALSEKPVIKPASIALQETEKVNVSLKRKATQDLEVGESMKRPKV